MTSQRMIDGIVPERIERPSGIDAIAELIHEVNVAGTWLMPLGGGTAMSGLNPVDAIPVALDLTGTEGIFEYEPTDLTVAVGAGTRWGALRDALAAEGQTLPIDVPFPDQATVGGVVATGYAGPRRLRDGSLKDMLLGASFVRGDGLAAKAGGMVVKNVSGFEVPRLLHGSWGSLAVIASVNLKVVPLHEFDITIQSDIVDSVEAVERVLALTRARSATAAATVDGTLQSARVAVRLTGREGPTQALAREVQDDAALPWQTTNDNPAASAAWWQERENRLATDEPGQVSIEIGCQPADVRETLAALRIGVPDAASITLHASPGIGSILVGLHASAMSIDTWLRIWAEHGLNRSARFVIASAPREWREERDVWSIPAGPRKIMQSLKTTFDPNDTLNRARLWTSAVGTRT